MRAAADHYIGFAAAEDLGCFADGLRRSGTGGQTIQRRPARANEHGQMREGHVRLLLQLARHVHALHRQLRPLHHVGRAGLRVPGRKTGLRERIKIERSFATAQVDADAIQIKRLRGRRITQRRQPRRPPGLRARGQGKLRISSAGGML